MNLELVVREAVSMQDPGDEFTARVMAAVGKAAVIDIRTRRRNRIVLAGALMALGAAAAMFALRQTDSIGTQSTQNMPLPAIAGPSVAVAAPSVVKAQVIAVATPLPRDEGTVTKPAEPLVTAPQVDASGRITVLVMPIADEYGVPGAKTAAEAFRAQLSRELGGMREFVVLDSGEASGADAAKADFRLTVTSLQARRPRPAWVEVTSTTGSTSNSGIPPGYEQAGHVELPGLGTQYWPVEAKIEDAKSAGLRGSAARYFSVIPYVGISGVRQPDTPCSMGGPLLRTNDSPLQSVQRLGNTCGNRTAIAAGLAEVMRQPKVDPVVTQQQLLMQLNDSNLGKTQRRQALRRLISSNAADMPPLDAASIKAVVEFVSALPPAQRKLEWLTLGGRKEPGLVQPLLDVLRRDPDEEISLQALSSLIWNHRGDQRVMAGIEVVAREDPRMVVRMAARRVALGDPEWNGYLLMTLRNSSLSYRERLQSVVVTYDTDPAAMQSAALPPILNDQEVTGLVIKLVREHKSEAAQREITRRVVSLLAKSDRPEVLDLMLELVQDNVPLQSSEPPQLEALQGLLRHREDPRVRKVLDQILAGEGDQRLQFLVEQGLKPPPSPR